MTEYAITGLDSWSAKHLGLWLFLLKSMEKFLFKCLVSIEISHLHKDEGDHLKLRIIW